ncbi:hypothetical protein [Aliarcobacter butzleri]|uniref:hypothetical protein n=1 Tax=Aliarcobacter butzleri TaxID=28197 RepID=UPI002B243E44|nr:hypothetical protein [Aliarcobacter butzleri]
MSNGSTKKQNDKFLEGLNYVEHRMMFLGHTFSEEGKNNSTNFSFDDYSEKGGKIVITQESLKKIKEKNKNVADDTIDKINELYKNLSCKNIIYNFLNNGCISIIIEYDINDYDFMENYQKTAGKKFSDINELLYNNIEEIIKNAPYNTYFKFIQETKCGILEKLIENDPSTECEIHKKSIDDDSSFVTDKMVYSQHFIFKKYDNSGKEIRYKYLKQILEYIKKTKDKYTKETQYKNLRQLLEDIKKSKQKFIKIKDLNYKPLKFGWGVRYWEKDNNKNKDTEKDNYEFLDTELLFLSRQVLVNSQIIISTEISEKILFDNDFGKKVEIEDLESFICSYKTFHQINDLMLMDFNEDTKLINSALFKYDDFIDLEESKKNGEDTILKILKNYETKSNKTSENIVGIILFIIGALTIYSVIHDIFQFVPIDKDTQKTDTRLIIFITITFIILGAAIYTAKKRYKIKIRNKIKELFKNNKVEES